MQKAKSASRTLEALKELYPEARTELRFHTPWELLVATQLAAQCTDARVNQVTPEFFQRWPGPKELSGASLEEVEEVIKPTGFFHNKARNLVGAAKMVCEKFACKLPETMQELIELPGVARKTANVILFAGFGKNCGLAVDTHVKRISYRLGLTENVDPVKIEQDLIKIFPQKEWGDLNHRMVAFGRDICKARKPGCAKCPMSGFCPKKKPPEEPGQNSKSEAQDELKPASQ